MAKGWTISAMVGALVLGGFLGTLASAAATGPAAAPTTAAATTLAPEKLTLSLLTIVGTDPIEYMFSVGDSAAFKDVKSLEKFIGELPAGSTLTWAPGCVRMGDEPLLNSPKDMEAFQKFCADHKVELVIIPSG